MTVNAAKEILSNGSSERLAVSYSHVAALGSSFAAGPGIPPIVDRFANRSGRNYAHLLAGRLGARLTDLTVTNATTANILERPQRVLIRKFPPQIEGVPRDADLVTITAGGNDLSYLGWMTRRAWANWLRAQRPTRVAGAALRAKAIPAITSADVERAASGLARTVEGARSPAPNARVLLVDYLTVVGESTRPAADCPLDEPAIAAYRTIGEQLAEGFAAAARASGAELVRVSEASRTHAVGSGDPWVSGFRPRSTVIQFHPNAAGMEGVADEIIRALGGAVEETSR